MSGKESGYTDFYDSPPPLPRQTFRPGNPIEVNAHIIPSKTCKKWYIVSIVILVLVCIGTGLYLFLSRRCSADSDCSKKFCDGNSNCGYRCEKNRCQCKGCIGVKEPGKDEKEVKRMGSALDVASRVFV